jgi:hypothetical protein
MTGSPEPIIAGKPMELWLGDGQGYGTGVMMSGGAERGWMGQ